MPEYRLSKAAEKDLMSIAQYGDEHFGYEQSDLYRDKLAKRFSIIAETPLHYPAVDHVRTGYRRSVCGVHSIYFRIEERGVEIMRIIGRQNLSAAFINGN